MKIYKVSQNQQDAMQEVLQAMASIQGSIATINQSLQILESTQVLPLFQRNTLIAQIQSGSTVALSINKINQAISAMTNISRTIPLINSSLRVLQDNDAIAKAMNIDFNTVQSTMIKSLQSGNYQQFQSMLAGFKQGLPAASNTQ